MGTENSIFYKIKQNEICHLLYIGEEDRDEVDGPNKYYGCHRNENPLVDKCRLDECKYKHVFQEIADKFNQQLKKAQKQNKKET